MPDGTLKEVNLLDNVTDQEYYETIMQVRRTNEKKTMFTKPIPPKRMGNVEKINALVGGGQ
uniref:Uncharacterized protein n=1 Tax=viral metagenome TaxID=1070528 RepID=A0A6C0FD53_9ZZZZ